MDTYGGLVDGLKIRNKGKVMFWIPFAMMVTKFVTVVVITQLYSMPGIAMMLMCNLQIAETCFYMHMRPFEEKSDYGITVFNGTIRLLLSYTLFLFTPFVNNAKSAQKVGNVFLYLTMGNILINISFAIFPALKQLVWTCKKNRLLRKMKFTRKIDKMIALDRIDKVVRSKKRSTTTRPKRSALKKFTRDEKELRHKQGLAIFKILINFSFIVDEKLLIRKVRFEGDDEYDDEIDMAAASEHRKL